MKSSLPLLCFALFVSAARAQDGESPTEVKLPPRELAINTLFSIPETKAKLDEAIAEAKKQNVSEQTILEARFLFCVDHKDDQGVIDLLPELEKKEANFSLDPSEIFSTKEDFLAVIEFARALQALKNQKPDEFKKHITEALWLSPGQASAFTPYIEKLRLSEHVKNSQISLDKEVSDMPTGKTVSLKTLLGGKRALLIHFWSPWSPECESSLVEIEDISDKLKEHDVVLASMLIDGKTEILAEAKELLKSMAKPAIGRQLIDSPKNSLAGQMRVTEMPTMILLSPEGKILHHGPPGDPALLEKMSQLPKTGSVKKP